MYVMQITVGSTRSSGELEEAITGRELSSHGWSETVLLLTYRNVPSLPAVRSDSFDSLEEAIEYVKSVEPTCPRVSLGGRPPQPTPSWEEHLDWLRERGLESTADGAQPRTDWAIREGRHPR